jgi:hydrogenase large subunit
VKEKFKEKKMATKIIINPVTRISGFLQVEVLIENNKIVDAKSSGMLFRGFEKMLKGRSPLDAIYFTERICGICSTAHGLVSTLALENAFSVVPSNNDKKVRDFLHGCEFLQNHIRHTYQYTMPDYCFGKDINPTYDLMEKRCKLPEDINKRITKNYVESFKYSRMGHEMLAELGGKAPHNHGIFVGGTNAEIKMDKYTKLKFLLGEIKNFIENQMLEDVNYIALYYPETYKYGKGYGNLMTFGCFSNYSDKGDSYVDSRVSINGKIEALNQTKIAESIEYAWYTGGSVEYTPENEDYKPDRSKKDAYSWIKAPRYKDYAMEVGPLARMILSNKYTCGISTMDRTIARVLEAIEIIKIMEELLEEIKLGKSNKTEFTIPEIAKGSGLADTTRGALGHWMSMNGNKINNYSIITPSAWNLSPMDYKGIKGPVEQALIGIEVEDIKNPVEIGRTIRSFDPCVSCATHTVGQYNSVEVRVC